MRRFLIKTAMAIFLPITLWPLKMIYRRPIH